MVIRRRFGRRRMGARPVRRRRFGMMPVRRRRVAQRVPRGVSILANTPKIYKLRYNEYFSLASASPGDLTSYVFRANDIYDPNYSGIGHQPFLHDTLSTLYKSFVVIGAKITFRVCSSTTQHPCMMGVFLSPDAAPSWSNNYGTIIEQGLGKHKSIITGAAMRTPVSVTHHFGANKFFNTNVSNDIETYGATFGSSPTKQAYFYCWIQDITHDTATSLNCNVTIDYIVKVSEPAVLPQS